MRTQVSEAKWLVVSSSKGFTAERLNDAGRPLTAADKAAQCQDMSAESPGAGSGVFDWALAGLIGAGRDQGHTQRAAQTTTRWMRADSHCKRVMASS